MSYTYFSASSLGLMSNARRLWKVPVVESQRFRQISAIGAIGPIVVMAIVFWLTRNNDASLFYGLGSGVVLGGICYFLMSRIGQVQVLQDMENVEVDGYSLPSGMLLFPKAAVIWLMISYLVGYF